MSATVFSSSVACRASPGSPSRAKPGALRRLLASRALPSPPCPPAARTYRVPAPIMSASTLPSASLTTVPSGTRTSRSSPLDPFWFPPRPCSPLRARRCGRWCRSSSAVVLGSTTRTTSPPLPPSPPSGPPSGLNFSRWTEATPAPPLPAATSTTTRSTKLGIATCGLLTDWWSGGLAPSGVLDMPVDAGPADSGRSRVEVVLVWEVSQRAREPSRSRGPPRPRPVQRRPRPVQGRPRTVPRRR